MRILAGRLTTPAVALAMVGVTPAWGQGAQIFAFALPRQSYSEALIAIGLKAGLSMLDTRACAGSAAPLIGRFASREALQQLLRDAPCRFEFIDPSTVRFLSRPAPAPPPRIAPRPPVRPSPVPSDPGAEVQAVVVTAQKRRESLLGVAGPVSVIGGAKLKTTEALDIRDVSLGLAALSLTNLGPARDKVLLRGVSDGAFTGRARSTVITYLDDAPITYNAPDPDLLLTDVERIEVIRGPQGALYGGGSIGGVYRIITKAPQLDAYGGSLTVRGSTTRGGASGGGGDGALNIPLIDGRLGIRLNAYYLDEGGYLQDDASRRSNVDRTVRSGGRFALLAKPAPAWSITLSAAFQHLATADTQYTTLKGPTLRRANLVRESYKSDFAEGGAVVEGDLGAARLHSATSYVRRDFASVYDASAALSLFDSPTADFGLYDETVHSQLLTQDIYLSTPEERPVSWLVGVFASRLVANTPSLLSARTLRSTTPRSLFSEERRDTIDEIAFYGDARVRLGDRWTASVGARAFRTQVGTTASTLTPTQPVTARKLDESTDHLGVSPKITLQYAWSPRTSAYVLASTGERTGGFNTGGLRAPPGDMRFAPDRLDNFEVGVKSRSLSGGLEASATLFHDRWRRLQTDQYYPSGLPYTANVGDGRLTGVEADVAVQPLRRLTLEANVLLTTSELVNPNPAFGRRLRGGLPGAPDASFVLSGEYRRPVRTGLEVIFAGEANYVSRSRLTFDVTAANTTSSSFVDAKLSAQLKSAHYRLTLAVANPQDSQANTFAYGNPFSFGQVRQATPQRPRTLELTLAGVF